MPRIVLWIAIVLLMGFAFPLSAQDPSYTQTPPEYTTTPPEYVTTPPEYVPLPDTVPPGFGDDEDDMEDDPYEDDDDSDDGSNDDEDQTPTAGNVSRAVQMYGQFFLGLDEVESQQFLNDFTSVAGQLGFQTEEVDFQTGVQIVLYLTFSRLLGFDFAATGIF